MFDLTYLHPMAVHFPIALLLVGFVSDLAGIVLKKELLSKVALILLLTGALGLAVAYLSGRAAGEGLAEGGALKEALEAHEDSAVMTLWLVIAAVAVRLVLAAAKKYSGALRWIPAVLLLAGALAVARTGHLGGQLVYKHAAGVQLGLEDLPPGDSQDVPGSQENTGGTDQKKDEGK